MTSDQDWDPTVLDCDHNDTDTPPDGTVPNGPSLHDNFNQHGEYMDRYVVTMADMQDTTLEDLPLPPYLLFRHDQHMAGPAVPDNDVTPVPTQARTVSRADPDYDALRPLFAYQPVEAIKHTWLNSTQFARIPMSTHLKRHFKSPFPAHNVARRNEPIATDTVYSNTPAVDNGAKAAQFFVGLESMVCDVFPMHTDKQFVNTLEDIIRRRGAPTKLVSDHAQVEISKKVLDILRSLCIDNWQSEAYQQQQNPAERRYQTVKRVTNTLMDRTGAPADTWFLCMSYVCFVLNHTACKSLSLQ
jgi:hypothetical protein